MPSLVSDGNDDVPPVAKIFGVALLLKTHCRLYDERAPVDVKNV